jgi:hypothetical protein
MTTLQPGYTNKGIICKDCIKYQKKYETFCTRKSHHQNRIIPKKRKTKSNNKKHSNENLLKKLEESSRDYNYAELITAVCLGFEGIQTPEDVIQHSDKIECHDLSGYLLNLKRRTDKTVIQYIEYINSIRHNFPNINRIILLGKSLFKYPEVINLNRGLEIKKCKADIILEDKYHRWIGISVKSSEKCYLSNYSLEKILPNGEELKQIKQRYLIDEGYPEFRKEDRKDVNELFYVRPGVFNPYWNLVIETIETHKIELTKFLLELLTSSYTHYPVYEIDGKSLVDLTRVLGPQLQSLNLQLVRDNTIRKSAKLVYHMADVNKKYYQVEIRWKGNVYQSPQIMILKM